MQITARAANMLYTGRERSGRRRTASNWTSGSMQPTGTITFLFTDIEGSTRLWESQREAMSAALARHDALLRGTIERHGGHEFKTVGDAFCAAFVTLTTALSAAVDAQRALLDEDWTALGLAASSLRVRMAIHSGTAEARDGD